jgi:hypothetical protein
MNHLKLTIFSVSADQCLGHKSRFSTCGNSYFQEFVDHKVILEHKMLPFIFWYLECQKSIGT